MWIIQEPKKLALWNKRHFEEKNGKCAACLKYSVPIFVEKIHKMQHLEGSGTPVLYIGSTVLNPLNAELNPICKSQLAELFCGVFKFCAWYSKTLNILRTKWDKFVKQKHFEGKETDVAQCALKCCNILIDIMEKIWFWQNLVNTHVLLLTL
jgi:hypothetical protein